MAATTAKAMIFSIPQICAATLLIFYARQTCEPRCPRPIGASAGLARIGAPVQHQVIISRLEVHMRRFAALATLAVVMAACSPGGEATGSINSCATELFPAYNPKIMDQCVAVCKKCDRGVTTTCTTSCTLKGAR
jgi:hypothetical protein